MLKKLITLTFCLSVLAEAKKLPTFDLSLVKAPSPKQIRKIINQRKDGLI